MVKLNRRCRTLAIARAVCACLLAPALLCGCSKKEPEPTVPGYYEGEMKPKGEVAPGPAGAAAKPGAKGPSVDD